MYQLVSLFALCILCTFGERVGNDLQGGDYDFEANYDYGASEKNEKAIRLLKTNASRTGWTASECQKSAGDCLWFSMNGVFNIPLISAGFKKCLGVRHAICENGECKCTGGMKLGAQCVDPTDSYGGMMKACALSYDAALLGASTNSVNCKTRADAYNWLKCYDELDSLTTTRQKEDWAGNQAMWFPLPCHREAMCILYQYNKVDDRGNIIGSAPPIKKQCCSRQWWCYLRCDATWLSTDGQCGSNGYLNDNPHSC
jgi:hypothetical protein